MEDDNYFDKFKNYFIRNQGSIEGLRKYFEVHDPDFTWGREQEDAFVDIHKTVEPMKNARNVDKKLEELEASKPVED